MIVDAKFVEQIHLTLPSIIMPSFRMFLDLTASKVTQFKGPSQYACKCQIIEIL